MLSTVGNEFSRRTRRRARGGFYGRNWRPLLARDTQRKRATNRLYARPAFRLCLGRRGAPLRATGGRPRGRDFASREYRQSVRRDRRDRPPGRRLERPRTTRRYRNRPRTRGGNKTMIKRYLIAGL